MFGLESLPSVFRDIGCGESESLSESVSSSELTVKSITSILAFFGGGPTLKTWLNISIPHSQN
jgi:hypothetical protein